MVPHLPGRVPTFANAVPGEVPAVPWLSENGMGTGSHMAGTGFQTPEPGSDEERTIIRELAGRGYSLSKIARLLGGRRQETLERVGAVMGALLSVEQAC